MNSFQPWTMIMIVTTCVGMTWVRLEAGPSPVGRWNVTITDGDRQIPSWMKIVEEEGKFKLTFMSEVAGQYDAGEFILEGNQVRFKSIAMEIYTDPRTWYTYTGTFEGDTMSGTRTALDKTQKWVAKRFVPQVNLHGTWRFDVEAGQAPPALKFTHKEGRLEGLFFVAEKLPEKPADLTDIRLVGDELCFVVREGRLAGRYQAKVKGDILEGRHQAEGREPVVFTARRVRLWGEPIELFNGKDLTGWKPIPGPLPFKWTVVDGIMMTPDVSANIVTEKQFRDFKLHVEFRVPPKGNSGVYLRGRYEIQVADSYGQPPESHACGGLYSRVVPTSNPAKPAGEWQTFDAVLIGQYLTLDFNGVRVIDNVEIEGMTGGALDCHDELPGPIYLQGDHGKIEYRRITLTPAMEP